MFSDHATVSPAFVGGAVFKESNSQWGPKERQEPQLSNQILSMRFSSLPVVSRLCPLGTTNVRTILTELCC